MELYDLAYLKNRVQFMIKMNEVNDAKKMIEREVDYVVTCCNDGRADIAYHFYKTFNKYLSTKAHFKLTNAINKSGNKKFISELGVLLDDSVNSNCIM